MLLSCLYKNLIFPLWLAFQCVTGRQAMYSLAEVGR